jgi:hypothetical protein
MSEMCSGVRTLVARMETNPEEFFGDATKWRFMFAANFREVLTEPEKGALHEALKEVRRKEFDTLVVKELMKEEMEQSVVEMRASGRYALANGGLGSTISTAPKFATALQVGNETLNEEDIKSMKASATSAGWFK